MLLLYYLGHHILATLSWPNVSMLKAIPERTRWVKQQALDLGFQFCGVSKAAFLEEEAPRLEAWLNQNYHGKMAYMARCFDERLDPRKLVPGARSVVTLLYNYHNPDRAADPEAPRISQYAYGKDYHHVIKAKLRSWVHGLEAELGAIQGRVFVDSAPVLERAWAKRSGVGWVGKNSNLIHPKAGSYYFLCEFISDLVLEPDGPMRDYCGTCTACMDACPTDAIPSPYVVDGSRCISYFTIELKDELLPKDLAGQFGSWAFGCDICQEVCPWNRFSRRHSEPAFEPPEGLLGMARSDWQELTEAVFQRLFRHSPVKRTGYKGLLRNLLFIGVGQDQQP